MSTTFFPYLSDHKHVANFDDRRMPWNTGSVTKRALPVGSSDEFCCPTLGEHHRLTPTDAIELAWRLRALAEPARVSIVSLLAGRNDHALTTRDLAPQVGLTEATVSHHLKQLAEAGIVDKHRDGARVLYHLNITAVKALASVLDVCCESDDSVPSSG